MDRETALALLDLPASAGETEIQRRVEQRRAEFEERVHKAATMSLKGKYRKQIDELLQAEEVLLSGDTGFDGLNELPVAGKVSEDDPYTSQGRSRGAPPPVPEMPSGPPPVPPTESRRGGLPPVPGRSRAATPPPPRGAVPPSNNRRHQDYPDIEGGEVPPIEPEPSRPPRPAWLLWTVIGGALLFLGGLSWAAWEFGIEPGKVADRKKTGVSVLTSVAPTIINISSAPDSNPSKAKANQDELAHMKARALSWTVVALATTGNLAEASTYLGEVETLITPMTGLSSTTDRCRYIAALAATGDITKAVSALLAIQQEREGAFRQKNPGGTLTPLPPTKQQDDARRSIAIAQARQPGQWQAARGTVNAILDDERACQALQEIVRQLIAANNEKDAISETQTLQNRAKKVADPSARAPLLVFVATQMRVLLGVSKSKKDVTDAFGSSSGSSLSNTGYADMEARKVLGDALMLPARLRLAVDKKDDYRRRLEDVFAAASNLQGSTGAITRQADFANRARIYAALAVAWWELGKGWFSGSSRERAQDMITKAVAAAEQAKPRAESTDGGTPSAQLIKDQSLAAVVEALAEMQQFDQAGQIISRMVDPAPLGEAGEAVAYHMGLTGQSDQARAFIDKLPEGEPRCRAAVALHYGLHKLPLERWW